MFCAISEVISANSRICLEVACGRRPEEHGNKQPLCVQLFSGGPWEINGKNGSLDKTEAGFARKGIRPMQEFLFQLKTTKNQCWVRPLFIVYGVTLN